MGGPHLQSHVTHQSRGHVASQNVLSPHLQDPWSPELGRVLNQDDRAPPKKSRDTSIVWSREKSHRHIF